MEHNGQILAETGNQPQWGLIAHTGGEPPREWLEQLDSAILGEYVFAPFAPAPHGGRSRGIRELDSPLSDF